MSTARYHLTAADLLAFNRYVLRRHRGNVAMQLLYTGLGLGVVSFLLLRADTHDTKSSLLTAGILGAIGVFLHWLYLRSQVKASIARQMATDPTVLGEREFEVSREGIRERTAMNDSFHAWAGLTSVALTPSHAFFHLGPLTAFIVPRTALPPDAIDLVRASVPHDKLWGGT